MRRVLAAATVAVLLAPLAACSPAGSDIAVVPPVNLPGEGPAVATANTVRLAGGGELEDAVAITQAVYPATIPDENVPGAIILAPVDDLAMQVTAVQVTHHPINAPVLYADADGIPEVIRTEMRRLAPEGVNKDGNTEVYVVGDLEEAAEEAEKLGFRVRRFLGDDPAQVAADIDRWKSALHGDAELEVVIGDPEYAKLMVPVASFYAHGPVSLLWTRDGEVPAPTNDRLAQRGGEGWLYLIGSPEVIDEDLATDLHRYGHVQRLDADTPVAMGVRNADYGDVGQHEFSWDLGEPGHNYTFAVVPERGDVPPAAVTATVLSHLGKHGPLLVVQRDQVPEEVRRFLQERRPTYVAPDESLFNHGWVIGGTEQISADVQADLDSLLAVRREPPTQD